MKKILVIILVLTMALGIFASCDGSTGAGNAIADDLKEILGDVNVDELPLNIDKAIEEVDKNAAVYTGELFDNEAKVIFKGKGALAGYSSKSEMTMESGKKFTATVETLIVSELVAEHGDKKEFKVVSVITKATLGGEGLDEYYAMTDTIFNSLCVTYKISDSEKASVRKIFDDYISGKEMYLTPEDKAFKMIAGVTEKFTLTVDGSTFESEYSLDEDDDDDVSGTPNETDKEDDNDPSTGGAAVSTYNGKFQQFDAVLELSEKDEAVFKLSISNMAAGDNISISQNIEVSGGKILKWRADGFVIDFGTDDISYKMSCSITGDGAADYIAEMRKQNNMEKLSAEDKQKFEDFVSGKEITFGRDSYFYQGYKLGNLDFKLNKDTNSFECENADTNTDGNQSSATNPNTPETGDGGNKDNGYIDSDDKHEPETRPNNNRDPEDTSKDEKPVDTSKRDPDDTSKNEKSDDTSKRDSETDAYEPWGKNENGSAPDNGSGKDNTATWGKENP